MKRAHLLLLVLTVLHVLICVGYWSFVHHAVWLIVLSNSVCMASFIVFFARSNGHSLVIGERGQSTTFGRLNLWWMVLAVALSTVGLQCRMMQGPWASEILLLAFAFWLLLLLLQLIMRFGYGFILPTRITLGVMLGFVITCAIASCSEKQAVHWRYRNYPEFIQIYEWQCLDPENEELRHQLLLEHYRIILSAEEFRSYQESHRIERRSKNQW